MSGPIDLIATAIAEGLIGISISVQVIDSSRLAADTDSSLEVTLMEAVPTSIGVPAERSPALFAPSELQHLKPR